MSIINPKFPPPVDILSETSDAELLEALIPQPVLGMMTEYRGILQEMLTVENNRICDLNR